MCQMTEWVLIHNLLTFKNDCHSDFVLKGLRVVSDKWMMETVRIKC